MNHLELMYQQHIKIMLERIHILIEKESLSALWIFSGSEHSFFQDDQGYPFKLNPHFNAWLPLLTHPYCWLHITTSDKPVLFFYHREDFWHVHETLPDFIKIDQIETRFISDKQAIKSLIQPSDAFVGVETNLASALGFKRINPPEILHYLNYHRAYKTDYEIECIRQANAISVKGHQAVAKAFQAKASEFELNQIYLQHIQHEEFETPYRSIIAHNENGAVLHYQKRSRTPPTRINSLLIDAGANYNGYAADISRTYALQEGLFADIVVAMQTLQQKIIDDIEIGMPYADLHQHSIALIAKLLNEFNLTHASIEQLLEENIVKAFYPHGLGHLLGIQVHDVGGNAASPYISNNPAMAHEEHRQRLIQPQQVMTIEPGIYFIEQLLNPHRGKKYLNWKMIDALIPFGGIRIEDNICVHKQSIENITQDAFKQAQ
jgi:Xaa-Pro dipeptidase